MTVIPFPSSRLTNDDLLVISGACCDLMKRGLAKGIVRVKSDEDDKIVCVTDDGNGCSYFGIGRSSNGTYYVCDGDGRFLREGSRVSEVLAALP